MDDTGVLRIYHNMAYHTERDISSLSSVGYITDDDHYFYGEITDCCSLWENPFIPDHVIAVDGVSYDTKGICVRGTRETVARHYRGWLFGIYDRSHDIKSIEYIGDMDTQKWELTVNKDTDYRLSNADGSSREFIKFTEIPIQYYYYKLLLPSYIPDIDSALRRAYFVKYEYVLASMPLEFQLDYTYGGPHGDYETRK